jgi:hypothetical protein
VDDLLSIPVGPELRQPGRVRSRGGGAAAWTPPRSCGSAWARTA